MWIMAWQRRKLSSILPYFDWTEMIDLENSVAKQRSILVIQSLSNSIRVSKVDEKNRKRILKESSF